MSHLDVIISNHLKMLQRCLNGFCLFLRTSRLPGISRFRLIIVLSLYDPVLPFYLSDIQVRHMKSVLLLHPVLDLFVCSPLLKPGHVHVFEREFNSDVLTRYVSLGKLYNRLDVSAAGEHVHGLNGLDGEASGSEELDVSGQCGRIAGNIDHAANAGGENGVDDLRIAALAGRVHDEAVDGLSLGYQFGKSFLRRCASGTTSMPMTLPAFRARSRLMVPMPQ